MEADGKLSVTFTDGLECTYSFKDIRTWRQTENWVMVFWPHKSVRWHHSFIAAIEVVNNSDEYVEWHRQEHPLPDEYYLCPGCNTSHPITP